MERVVDLIMQYVEENGQLDCSQKEILKFGIQSALEIITNIFCSILILYKIGMLREGLLFFCIFIPTRTFSGGYHSDTYIRCLLFSIITLIGVMVASKSIEVSEKVVLPVIFFLEIVIGKIAPVINAERPVSYREYKMFCKRLKIVMIVIAMLSVCLVCLKSWQLVNVILFSLVLILITLIVGKIKYKQYQMEM